MVSLFTLGINLIVCISSLFSCVPISVDSSLATRTRGIAVHLVPLFNSTCLSCLPTSFCAHQTPLILDNNPTLQLLSQLHDEPSYVNPSHLCFSLISLHLHPLMPPCSATQVKSTSDSHNSRHTCLCSPSLCQ